MRSLPELSAIVVSHRSADEASACVAALRKAFERGGVDGEIVLVDCGSGAQDVARLRECRPDRMRAIDNRGYSGGVNAGISESRGRLLLFCNADTEIDPDALPPLIDAIRSKGVGAAAPLQFADRERRLRLPTGFGCRFLRDLGLAAGRSDDARFARHARFQWRLWTEGGDAENLVGSVLLTRRDVVDGVGRFDERYPFEYEETEWEDRVRASGRSLRVVPEAVAHHFPGTSSRRNPGTDERRNASRRRYRFRRYGRLGLAILEAAERRRRPARSAPEAAASVAARSGHAVAASPNASVLPFVGIALDSPVESAAIVAAIGGPLFLRVFRVSDGLAGPVSVCPG
jgi:hypothetical protein